MASMAAVFGKTSYPSHQFPISFSKHVSRPIRLPVALSWKKSRKRRVRISGGLIDPDGGKLVELLVEESMRDSKKKEALCLPRIKLSRIDLQWVHALSEGWASPLSGFMREPEFLQTLHFNSLRLHDGSVVNMSVPIVLAIDDAQKHQIGASTQVALFSSDDRPVAILKE